MEQRKRNIKHKGEMMTTNLTLAKEVTEKYSLHDSQHKRRLLDVLDDNFFSAERMELKLAEAGFIWFITLEKVLRFKYHACVRGGVKVSSLEERYVGDIPDFALSNAQKAIDLGIKFITIHSMQEMPVVRAKTDPLMVGWYGMPCFNEGRREIKTGEKYFTGREYISCLIQRGFVIAIWDGDKELEL